MRTNPGFLALLIAFAVALMIFVASKVGLTIPGWNEWILIGTGFGVTFLIALIVLEFMLFQEIRKVSQVLKNLSNNTLPNANRRFNGTPIENFKDLVMSYTEVKQMEIEQLKSMAAYRREFLADVSHELKTPIFAAQGYVHTLLDGAIDDDQVKMRFLKRAAKSLDGLDVLVQDLLVLSRLETGQITMDIQTFNIYDLSAEVFEQLENKADKKNIVLGFGSGTYKNILVQADQHRIQQVLQSLVLNGINYTEEGGRVTVDFEIKRDQVVVHIKDTGKGIPPEHLDRIFQRFYRVEKSRGKSNYRGGTGLGLAIVKHILDQHQTKIQVKSTPNKGSDFYFELPKAK